MEGSEQADGYAVQPRRGPFDVGEDHVGLQHHHCDCAVVAAAAVIAADPIPASFEKHPLATP